MSDLFEPKLPPINLWAMAPAWIFYARLETAKAHKPTTKVCKCGSTKLVPLSSQNMKICDDCKTRIPWKKEDDEKPYWG